jgi:nicotinamide-nucleotide amidase
MKAGILIIGDEILNGTTLDSNSNFIAHNCVMSGISIKMILTVSDSYAAINEGLNVIKDGVDVVFITGGLGPTKDDITMKALSDFFGQKLVFNEEVFEKIKAYFEKRGNAQVKLNEKLAFLPERCELLTNEKGTAQGMWFEEQGKVFVSMPGVPYEMKHMFVNYVLPKLQGRFKLPQILNKYIMTVGIGESAIAERIEDIENALPPYISLAYLPSPGRVKLRLTSLIESCLDEIVAFQQQIAERLSKYVFALDENKSIEQVVGEILLANNATISTAESCTGGLIAHKITSIAGSSAYYMGSVISYSNDVKIQELHVSKKTLENHGAVSEQTVEAMVKGLLKKMQTTYGIAVSGVAGPGGGRPGKPVGTVWIAVGSADKIVTRKYQLTPHRMLNIEITAMLALNLLRRFVSNNIESKGYSNMVEG